MVKIRSKLKRHTKGKAWSKGHSATSNPENMKHRMKAKSRFFQSNLSLAPQQQAGPPSTLTLSAVMKHDARQMFEKKETTVNDVAGSLMSFSLDDDEMMSASQGTGTFKTFQTFASNYSACSNMSFKKLMSGFRASSDLHKEMLAILTALTEIIQEKGGSQSSTEYFILLMETIEVSNEESEIIAGVSLLSMGIKSVPEAVLRKRFGETANTLMGLLEKHMDSNNQGFLKSIISCLSVLLRAQDYDCWSYSSTLRYVDAITSFTIHSKPKIRKAAQHAIIAIIHGSCFMLPKKDPENPDEEAVIPPKVKFHPIGGRVVKFCLNLFKSETLANSQTTVLHALELLKDTISGFKTEDIKLVCESILSIMTASNVLLRTNCYQLIHALFASRTENLNGDLCAKIIAAIYEYRPDRTDARQILAWLTVLKEGHLHLITLSQDLCINSLPRLVDILATDLWLSDRSEIVSGVSNALKEILYECIKPICSSQESADIYRPQISKIITLIGKVLSTPFGEAAKFVILTCSILFEVTGQYFGAELQNALSVLGNRYDTQSNIRIHIEHAIISAIKSMGPELVLKTISLTNAKGEILLDKSWLLPLLREGASGASFKFFKDYVLVIALDCNKKWTSFAEQNQVSLSHTYELLCCQLWGLLPGFCRHPKDPESFKIIAPTLGNALDNNPEFRAPILDAIAELITNENEIINSQLDKFAKNFLPRLFNVYAQKPTGTYEADLRKKTYDVIKLYLTICSKKILGELFESSKGQLIESSPGTFETEAIFDITALLLIYQTDAAIKDYCDKCIVPVLKGEKSSKFVSRDDQKLKRQQKKNYELLKEILQSENPACKAFVTKNAGHLQTLLLEAFKSSCNICQASRLHCLKILLDNKKNLKATDKIVKKIIPETLVNFKEFSTKKESIAFDLLTQIGDLYQDADLLNDFVDMIVVGFGGDDVLITNTILALRAVVQHLTGNLTISTLEFILQQIAVFIVGRHRGQAEASIAFLITFTKVLPSPLIATHLEIIMRSLSAMVPDTKRFCRIQIGYLFKKLCKRFTADELIKYVPGNDELTHRRLKKIQKMLRREARKKAGHEEKEDDSDDADSEDGFVEGLEKKSITIDDILEDSDSDLPNESDDEMEEKPQKGAKKSKKTFIKEAPEEIVDLADIKSIGNVLTNKPSANINTSEGANKKKKENGGFKTAEDGRLIISDKFVKDSDDSDEDEDGDDGPQENKKVKRGMEDDSSSDDEDMLVVKKKKGSESVKSEMTSGSKYVAGGKGIHRNLGASSVKSGYSGISRMSTATAKSVGSVYKSKKAQGDMKKKGKLDPYAYIPLSRNILNKRKRSKNVGQFKSLVSGKAKKNTSKGKVTKSYK